MKIITIQQTTYKMNYLKEEIYWTGLPIYGSMYIRPALEICETEDDLVHVCKHFLKEYETSCNPNKKLVISIIIFPIYEECTGIDYLTLNIE